MDDRQKIAHHIGHDVQLYARSCASLRGSESPSAHGTDLLCGNLQVLVTERLLVPVPGHSQ